MFLNIFILDLLKSKDLFIFKYFKESRVFQNTLPIQLVQISSHQIEFNTSNNSSMDFAINNRYFFLVPHASIELEHASNKSISSH